VADTIPTRKRLVDAGMALFAQQGYRATTVGQIEASVGLQPRRGGLYKHFETKEALLREAAAGFAAEAAVGAAQIAVVPEGLGPIDPAVFRPLVAQLGRWFLDALDQQRALVSLLDHEGDRLADLARQVRDDIVDVGNRAAARLLAVGAPGIKDPEATAVLLLGSLVGLRRTQWTFGAPPLGIDDERALDRWVDIVVATVTSEP
jgi:AcrR family transcriptional regulator